MKKESFKSLIQIFIITIFILWPIFFLISSINVFFPLKWTETLLISLKQASLGSILITIITSIYFYIDDNKKSS